jgi:ADP-ribosyl-[dinitrogen reductase] hydrolase
VISVIIAVVTRLQKMTSAQLDRAIGVIAASAVGDALGAGYEFGPALPATETPEYRFGGLQVFGPAEWTDDTEMALCIAEVTSRMGIETSDARDLIASNFLNWGASWARDVGTQTRSVLSRAAEEEDLPGARLALAAHHHYKAHGGGAAGNGALMRTGPVGIAALDDRQGTASAARGIAELTHGDPLAGDSCVLWCDAIRRTLLRDWGVGEALTIEDLVSGVELLPAERQSFWLTAIGEATGADPRRFGVKNSETGYSNGFTVGALQCAWAAITSVPVPRQDPSRGSFACQHLQLALEEVVRAGHDTDTVGAIAGSLLGARWGASAIPAKWRRLLHGRGPGRGGRECSDLRARDLVTLAVLTVRGHDDEVGWPSSWTVDYGLPADFGVAHPADAGVTMGTAFPATDGYDAIVSLCRIGWAEPWAEDVQAGNHVEVWLMDKPEPAANPNLHFVIDDAARSVATLRSEGHRVWLHCVAAHNRTPTVAARYGVLCGRPVAEAKREVAAALSLAYEPTAPLWRAIDELGEAPPMMRSDDHG